MEEFSDRTIILNLNDEGTVFAVVSYFPNSWYYDDSINENTSLDDELDNIINSVGYSRIDTKGVELTKIWGLNVLKTSVVGTIPDNPTTYVYEYYSFIYKNHNYRIAIATPYRDNEDWKWRKDKFLSIVEFL